MKMSEKLNENDSDDVTLLGLKRFHLLNPRNPDWIVEKYEWVISVPLHL